MKKLFTMIAVALMLASATSTYAQTPTGTPDPKTTTHVKKDGTPDKRYKENKTTTKSTTTKKAAGDTTKKVRKARAVKKATPATN